MLSIAPIIFMDNLLSCADFVEFEQVAVGIVEEEYMPFTFAGEADGRRDKFHARCLQPFVGGRDIFDTKTDMCTWDVVDRVALDRAGGIEPLDEIQCEARSVVSGVAMDTIGRT